MHIHLSQPISFSHIGQRMINQDTLFPQAGQATESTPLFIVCDGMGGADKGEIASRLLCDAVLGYVNSMDFPILDAVHLRTALSLAHDAYVAFLGQNPLVNRMGSTLALLQFHDQGATVAHIGDSRVYQFRAGKIIFQTKDHRQVDDMVEAGIITAAQAATHPWRNRLSRAMTVSAVDKDKPENQPSVDCTRLTDVQKGDYFFLCTDGLQEQIDNTALETGLTGGLPDTEKVDLLLAACRDKTKDNYSGHLIGIDYVTATKAAHPVGTVENYAA